MDSARRDRSEITKSIVIGLAAALDAATLTVAPTSVSASETPQLLRPGCPQFSEITIHGTAESKKKTWKKKKKSNRSRKSAGRWMCVQHCWTSQASRRPRVSGMDTSSPNVSDDDEVGKGPPSWLRDVWGQRPTTPPPLARTSSRTTLPVWHNEGRVVPTSMWLKESHTSAGLSALRGWEEAQEAELARAAQNALEIAQVPAAPSFYLALFSVLPTQDVTFI